MKDFLTKKLLEEYLPDNSEFTLMFNLPNPAALVSTHNSYCGWFDTRRRADVHGAHRRKVYGDFYSIRRARLLFGGEVAGIYIVFDMSNGDKGSKRYCWLFNSRKTAQEHIKNQHARKYGARLSAPHKMMLL